MKKASILFSFLCLSVFPFILAMEQESKKNLEIDVFIAIMNNDIEKLKELLNQNRCIVNSKINGNTPLISATAKNQLEIVKLLIEFGAFINDQNDYGNTALISAAINNNIKIMEVLINAGANPNIKNKEGYNALMSIILNQQEMFALYHLTSSLLSKNIFNQDDLESGLVELIERQKSIVGMLIRAKINLEDKNNIGETALILAIKDAQKHIAEVLINSGAKIDEEILRILKNYKRKDFNIFKHSPFFSIFRNKLIRKIFKTININDYKIFKTILLLIGLHIKDKNGNTLLHKAIQKGNKFFIGTILSLCPYLISIENNKGETPVQIAIGNSKILNILFQLTKQNKIKQVLTKLWHKIPKIFKKD